MVITGFFEKETFVPDTPVSLPQGKRVVITIQEEKAYPELSFKELSAKAKILRSRIESKTGTVDVLSLIHEGRK